MLPQNKPDRIRILFDDHRLVANAGLRRRRIALIWDASGFRNRVAFELGIAELGGVSVEVPGCLDERELIEDVVRYLDNWFDAIVARTATHEHMLRLAQSAQVPVVNARTSFNHPCEILGDLAYLRKQRGDLDGLRVAFIFQARIATPTGFMP